MLRTPIIILAILASMAVPFLQSAPLGLVLPTDNDTLFTDPSQFYMYTYRNFEGVQSTPWQAGGYGLVRNQKRTPDGIIGTRIHEGVDIRAVRRDAAGNPLDEVRAIADGTVVYVTASATQSNYGHYIVVHHDWGDGPFFSLYAHLSAATAAIGQMVKTGDKIGQMGFTGVGINRERSHVHLELNFILSDRYTVWHDLHFKTKNNHGIYNGINLSGMDIAALYLAHRSDPAISIPAFLAQQEVHYKVTVPAHPNMAFLRRYPWIMRGLEEVPDPKSWEFSFTATGVPVAVQALSQPVTAPVVSYVKPIQGNHADHTVSRLSGSGATASLSASGSRYIQLITDSF